MSSRARLRLLGAAVVAALIPACGNVNSGHPVLSFTDLVSVGPGGVISNGTSGQGVLSQNGRYVVFISQATNLGFPNPTGKKEVYRRDLVLGITEQVSVGPGTGSGPVSGNDDSGHPAVTADGRFVAFESTSSNFGFTTPSFTYQIFVRDMNQPPGSGLSIASTDPLGNPGDVDSQSASITPDGRYVAMASFATIFGNNPIGQVAQIYRKDLTTGAIIPISVTPTGGNPTPSSPTDIIGSITPSISADGSKVAYASTCIDIVPNDTNGLQDVFLATVGAGGAITTVKVSNAVGGGAADGVSADPSISADGLWVGFDSRADDLISFDANITSSDVFLYSVAAGTIELISVNTQGLQGAGPGESFNASVSSDGRFVAFNSTCNNLAPGLIGGGNNVFLRDRLLGTTILISVDTSGNQAAAGDNQSVFPSVASDGSAVVFVTLAAFVNADTNGLFDVYIRAPIQD